MSALDELLSPNNFLPCDPLRGAAARELELLRDAVAKGQRYAEYAHVATIRMNKQRNGDGETEYVLTDKYVEELSEPFNAFDAALERLNAPNAFASSSALEGAQKP